MLDPKEKRLRPGKENIGIHWTLKTVKINLKSIFILFKNISLAFKKLWLISISNFIKNQAAWGLYISLLYLYFWSNT